VECACRTELQDNEGVWGGVYCLLACAAVLGLLPWLDLKACLACSLPACDWIVHGFVGAAVRTERSVDPCVIVMCVT
jgi:hypothetical protein